MVSRREFFRGAWLKEPAVQDDEAKGADPYFASFSNCYALLSEIPLEELLVTARAAGFATENKSKLELAKELFSG
ncbi:MAG TPA: hypothetical protein VN521_04020, partial [Negativicutes bacterium]|nr:hypothetical protein [Negativicutes bacterium]